MNLLRRLFKGGRQPQETQVPNPEPEDTLPQEPNLAERRLNFEERAKVHLPYYAAELAVVKTLNELRKKGKEPALETQQIASTYSASIQTLMRTSTTQLDTLQVDFFGIEGPIENPTAYIFEAHNRDRRNWQIGFIIKKVPHESDDSCDHTVEPFDTSSLYPSNSTPSTPQ